MKQISDESGLLYILMENLVIALQLVCGTVVVGILKPIAGVVYILSALFMLMFFLRRETCTCCDYYGKRCHCGWGAYSALLFKKDSGKQKRGMALAGPVWGLVTLIPFAAGILHLIADFTLSEIVLFGFFVILSGLNFGLHFRDCRECLMSSRCSGSPWYKK